MNNSKQKRVLAAVLTGAMALSLAACGGGSGGDEKMPEDPADLKATIVVGGWPSGDDGFKAAIPGFNEKYPNVTVELDFTDTTAHHQALATALAAGSDAPDVAMVEGAYIAQYRDSTALVNLKAEPYNVEKYKDDFVGLKWEQCYSADGSRMVALPWDVGPTTTFYRRDVFDEVGLPSDPESVSKQISTWDGIMEAAEKIYKPGERWFCPSVVYYYQLMFMDRDYYNEDLTLRLDRDGDIDCLNMMIEMRKNGWDMNVDMWTPEANAAFQSGACATVTTGGWYGGFLKKDIDPDGAGHWGVADMPGGIKRCNWGGSFLVIPEQSKNKMAAWAFTEYMLATTRAQNEMLAAVDYFPAYIPAYEDTAIYGEEDPYFAGQKTKEFWAEIARDIKPVFNTIMDTTAEGCFYGTVNAALDQGLDAQGIKDQLAKDIETATAELKNQQIQVYKDAGLEGW